jgi:hypothetical protein
VPIRDPGIAARVEYKPDFWPYNVTVEVDMNNMDPVQLVLHELSHVILSPLLDPHMDETLEEVVMVAFDQYMYQYVSSSPARLTKWKTLIEKKLKESTAEDVPTPLEELVDRS